MSDRFEGAARDMGGRVQQKVGEIAGDAKTQAEGCIIRRRVRRSSRPRASAT